MARPDQLPRHGDPTELDPRPRPVGLGDPSPTTAQLRQDINSGITGDKIPVFDPGASPLGTDDEAAGAPPDPETIAKARALERAHPMQHQKPPDGPQQTGLGLKLGAIVLALVVVGVLVAMMGQP